MPGAFIPQCDEQGDFMPVQCHASTGACWCANSDGTEIDGTRGMYRVRSRLQRRKLCLIL